MMSRDAVSVSGLRGQMSSESRVYEDILVTEPSAGVVLLTLNRPDRLNAMRLETYSELADALKSVEPRVLVITGAGRGFCSGDDMQEMFGGADGESIDMGEDPVLDDATRLLLSRPYPIIAAVNGPAVGFGMGLALMADLRVVGESARFAELYIQRGQLADVTAFGRLWQLVGRERATWMILTGRSVTGEQAERWGLASEVVADEKLVERALDLAKEIASLPPLSLAASKAGIARMTDPDWSELGAWCTPQHAALFRTNDHREAVSAYVERRTPKYSGT